MISFVRGTTIIFNLSNLLKYQPLPDWPLLIIHFMISFLISPWTKSLKYLNWKTLVSQFLFSALKSLWSGTLCWLTISKYAWNLSTILFAQYQNLSKFIKITKIYPQHCIPNIKKIVNHIATMKIIIITMLSKIDRTIGYMSPSWYVQGCSWCNSSTSSLIIMKQKHVIFLNSTSWKNCRAYNAFSIQSIRLEQLQKIWIRTFHSVHTTIVVLQFKNRLWKKVTQQAFHVYHKK